MITIPSDEQLNRIPKKPKQSKTNHALIEIVARLRNIIAGDGYYPLDIKTDECSIETFKQALNVNTTNRNKINMKQAGEII